MMKSYSSHIEKFLKYLKLIIECLDLAVGRVSKSYESTMRCYQVVSKEKFVDDQISNI